jgi:hypothetical protein
MVVVDRMIVRSKLLAGLLSVFLLLVSGVARAQEPLFAFVQISDSQPMNAVDQQIFELVLDEIGSYSPAIWSTTQPRRASG